MAWLGSWRALGTALAASAAHAQFDWYANEIGKIDVSAVSASAKLQNARSISVLPGYRSQYTLQRLLESGSPGR
jgi:hypothetical protein